MNNDKKYHITLGIMIFLFLIIIAGALAVGLGIMEFNFSKLKYNDNAVQEDISNEKIDNDKNLLDEAYKKYDNMDWLSKNKNRRVVYIENGKLMYELNKEQIEFSYGTPIIAAPNPGKQSFDYIYVINEKGEVYRAIPKYENNKEKFDNIEFKEKIVDMAIDGTNGVDCFEGPYFMTESGKVLNVDGKTYEEKNENRIYRLEASPVSVICLCDDNTIDVATYEDDIIKYVKIKNENGSVLKAKQVFASGEVNNYLDVGYYIIDEDSQLYYYMETKNINIANLKQKSKVESYNYDEEKHELIVTFEDNTTLNVSEVVDGYDLVNKKGI